MESSLNNLLYTLKHINYSITNLYKNTNTSLNIAKENKLSKKELDLYFDNYRKDKFLKELYENYTKRLIKVILNYKEDNSIEKLEKIYIHLLNLIGIHESTLIPNEYGESNGKYHLSVSGFLLISSFEFNKLYELIKILRVIV